MFLNPTMVESQRKIAEFIEKGRGQQNRVEES